MSRSTMYRSWFFLAAAMTACGGGGRADHPASPAAASAKAALTPEQCDAAYRRLQEVPECRPQIECSLEDLVAQRTLLPAGETTRRNRSCARLLTVAWYDCALHATTWSAWQSCEPALNTPYQPMPAGKGPIRLARGVPYVMWPDVVTIERIGGTRATAIDVDTGTDEQRERALEVGDELDLTHDYPRDPEPSTLPPGFDDGMSGPPAAVDDAGAPSDLEITPIRIGGPRFRVVEIAADHVVLERLARRQIPQ